MTVVMAEVILENEEKVTKKLKKLKNKRSPGDIDPKQALKEATQR